MLLKKADPFSYLSRYKHNVLNTCLFLSRIVLFQEIKQVYFQAGQYFCNLGAEQDCGYTSCQKESKSNMQ